MAFFTHLVIVQLLCLIGIFFVTLVACILPLKLISLKQNKYMSPNTERVVSFLNCLSAGVFIATCFLGLLPFSRSKFDTLLKTMGHESHIPFAEATVLLGFFLILFIEQSVMKWQDRKDCHFDQEMSVLHTYEPLSTGDDYNQNNCKNDGSNVTLNSSPENVSTKEYQDVSEASSNCSLLSKKDGEDSSFPGHDSGGHGHSHDLTNLITQGSSLRFFIFLFAISTHSVFEGIALGLQEELDKVLNLFFAILLHETLVSFAMGVSLARLKFKFSTGLKFALLFCVMIPVGIVIGLLISNAHSVAGSFISAFLQAVAAGVFIHVTFLEMLPSELNGRDRLWKVSFFFTGYAILCALTVAVQTFKS